MKEKVVVTGGGGFVGKALCLALIKNDIEVVSLARGNYPELIREGVTHIQCDLSRATEDELLPYLKGVTTIYHTASKVSMWGRFDDFFATNVVGTRVLLNAAKKSGVPYFIYTSSPSVIADGTDLRGIDESYPYPEHFEGYYPATKAQAEQEVLAANSQRSFYTVALRPHLIFGPEDRSLIPAILKRASQKRLTQVGSGQNLVDLTYIDDCIQAHLKARQALEHNPAARGRAFFISQGDPVSLWPWINTVLEHHGLPPVARKISLPIALRVAKVMELIFRLLPAKFEPPFTRFLAHEMATDHYFSLDAARNLLGYHPSMTVAEATKRTFEQQ